MKKFPGFFPKRDAEKLIWSTLFKIHIGKHGPEVAFKQEVIDENQAICQEWTDAIQQVNRIKQELKASVKHKKEVEKKAMKIISRTAAYIKKLEKYTPAIGSSLGILGGFQWISKVKMRPEIKATPCVDGVRIDFVKQYAPAICIYSRRAGEANWQCLTQRASSPFVDTRPTVHCAMPETREYFARCHDGQNEIGQDSDIAMAVCHVIVNN